MQEGTSCIVRRNLECAKLVTCSHLRRCFGWFLYSNKFINYITRIIWTFDLSCSAKKSFPITWLDRPVVLGFQSYWTNFKSLNWLVLLIEKYGQFLRYHTGWKYHAGISVKHDICLWIAHQYLDGSKRRLGTCHRMCEENLNCLSAALAVLQSACWASLCHR